MKSQRSRFPIVVFLVAIVVSVELGPAMVEASETGTTGAGSSIDNMRPFLALNYMIATNGVWPYPAGADAGGNQMRGEIRLFAGNFEPGGWMFCDGRLLLINSNIALFSLIGTTYGGDGATTFALPDLRGRAASETGTGPGLSPRSLAGEFGAETATLSVAQLPSHSHPVPGSATGATGGAQPISTLQPTLPLDI